MRLTPLLALAFLLLVACSAADAQSRGVERFTGDATFNAPVFYLRHTDFTPRLGAASEPFRRTLDHGPNGEPPPAQHQGLTLGDHVYTAAGHGPMVAAPNAQFYGATYLDLTTRPVFGADGLTLRFDMATWVHNPGRSWLSWTIYPAEQDAGLPFGVPLEGWLPEPLRMPADYVHIRTNQFNGKPQWEGFTPAGKMGGRWYVDWWAAGLPMNQRDRSTFELSIQPNGRVKLCAPAVGHCWVDATVDVSRLSGKTLLIVLGIHEYTPDKDVRFLTFAGASGEPTTWHLENVTLAGDSMTIPPMQSSPTVSPTVQPSPVASPTPTPSPSPEPPTFKPLADYTHDELLDEIRRRLTDG